MPLENFFLDYGKQDREPGEFVRRLLVPKLPAGDAFSRLQNHQAHRRGYFRGAGGVLPEGRGRPDQRSESRVRRHGGNPETRKGRRSKTARTVARATRAAGSGRRRGRQGFHAADRSARQRRLSQPRCRQSGRQGDGRNRGRAAAASRASSITGWSPMPPNDAVLEAPLRHVYKPLPHDSGAKHVQGAAEYIDDIPEPVGTLHVAVGGSPVARGTHARRRSRRGAQRARRRRGHHRGRHTGKERHFAGQRRRAGLCAGRAIYFHSQPVFAVIATSRDAARRAALRGQIEVDAEKPNVSVEQGRASGETVLPDYAFINGDAAKAIAAAPLRSTGTVRIGGQEHFYLEGQVALAVPGEDGAVLVYSSTQHPSEVQHIVARVLGVPDSFVTCRVRRMGGGFGGKETQATQWAVIAALAARVTGRPCKLRLDRDADMVDDRQAARFRRRIRRRLRTPTAASARVDLDLDARCGCSADRQHRRRRSRHVPCRQCLFPAGIPHPFAARQDQYRVEYRLPRLRRPAGHDGDRARDRRDRLEPRPRSARRAQGQSLRRRPRRHALRPNRRRSRRGAAADRAAGTLVRTIAAGARRSRNSTRARRFSSAASR